MFISNSLEFAIAEAFKRSHEFIVAEECRERYEIDGEERIRTRKFYVWKDAKEYSQNIDVHNHCHEIIYDRGYGVNGRLVFDFDIKYELTECGKNIPKKFKSDIEKIVIETFNENYKNVNTDIMEFIWLSSGNNDKMSKHLVVKNAFFEDWIEQTKYFYEKFKVHAEKSRKFLWIGSNDIVDFQLARRNASLRLPFNSKIGGSTLTFDDENSFFDGLIYPISDDRLTEQRIFLYQQNEIKKVKRDIIKNFDSKSIDLAISTFKRFDTERLFSVGKLHNQYIQLLRRKKGKCFISGKEHESDNACLIVQDNKIMFYCHRGCKNPHTNKSHIIIYRKRLPKFTADQLSFLNKI